jgi:hypothetical protein
VVYSDFLNGGGRRWSVSERPMRQGSGQFSVFHVTWQGARTFMGMEKVSSSMRQRHREKDGPAKGQEMKS